MSECSVNRYIWEDLKVTHDVGQPLYDTRLAIPNTMMNIKWQVGWKEVGKTRSNGESGRKKG